ncbi:MAG: thioredoxin family protein [Promethearchaeota archaeon]
MYPKILFFSSKYCAPCKVVEKILERVNLSLFGNKLNIDKIDIDASKENLELSKKYNVMSVPTIIINDKRLSGSIEQDDLVDAILQGFLSSVSLDEDDEN